MKVILKYIYVNVTKTDFLSNFWKSVLIQIYFQLKFSIFFFILWIKFSLLLKLLWYSTDLLIQKLDLLLKSIILSFLFFDFLVQRIYFLFKFKYLVNLIFIWNFRLFFAQQNILICICLNSFFLNFLSFNVFIILYLFFL